MHHCSRSSVVVCPLRSGPSARALAHAVVDFRACAVIYIPKRNKLIPKHNKLTFPSVTFDIPKCDGYIRTLRREYIPDYIALITETSCVL